MFDGGTFDVVHDPAAGEYAATEISDSGPSLSGGLPKVEISMTASRKRSTQEFKDDLCRKVVTRPSRSRT